MSLCFSAQLLFQGYRLVVVVLRHVTMSAVLQHHLNT